MNKEIFGINSFNLISDDKYYYVFRALTRADQIEINEGITSEKGEMKKMDIIRTAETLFCRYGYEATSIQDILDALVFDYAVADGNKQDERTGEQADVIVGEYRQRERYNVQLEPAVSEQGYGARDDQRQQGYGVEPDDVPVVAHDE